MKKLSDFFEVENDVFVNDIVIDSRLVKKNDMFVCVKGVKADRHDFIPEAISNGASCIVGSRDIECSIPYIKVDNPDAILVDLCKKNYDFDGSLISVLILGDVNVYTGVSSTVPNDIRFPYIFPSIL